MYIPIGAPDEMKLGTAMSLLRLLIFEITLGAEGQLCAAIVEKVRGRYLARRPLKWLSAEAALSL